MVRVAPRGLWGLLWSDILLNIRWVYSPAGGIFLNLSSPFPSRLEPRLPFSSTKPTLLTSVQLNWILSLCYLYFFVFGLIPYCVALLYIPFCSRNLLVLVPLPPTTSLSYSQLLHQQLSQNGGLRCYLL